MKANFKMHQYVRGPSVLLIWFINLKMSPWKACNHLFSRKQLFMPYIQSTSLLTCHRLKNPLGFNMSLFVNFIHFKIPQYRSYSAPSFPDLPQHTESHVRAVDFLFLPFPIHFFWKLFYRPVSFHLQQTRTTL